MATNPHIFTSPVSVILPRKTKADRTLYLNLNAYRNWHHSISNDAKQRYTEAMVSQMDGVVFSEKIHIIYQLYVGDKRARDKGNVLSIIQKFFLDSLVHYGCIPDDRDVYIGREIFEEPKYDKGRARVEIMVFTSKI